MPSKSRPWIRPWGEGSWRDLRIQFRDPCCKSSVSPPTLLVLLQLHALHVLGPAPAPVANPYNPDRFIKQVTAILEGMAIARHTYDEAYKVPRAQPPLVILGLGTAAGKVVGETGAMLLAEAFDALRHMPQP